MNITATIRFTLPLAILLGLASPAFAQPTVFVGNQGQFGADNGGVTAHDLEHQTTTVEAVPNLNTLVQSITAYDGRGYIMANTSDRVDVIDLATHARVGQVLDIPSPRYMAAVQANKAYISNLFSGTVTLLNLDNLTVAGTVAVGDNPEGIAVQGSQAYVANFGFGESTTLSVIDTDTDQVVETRDVGCDGPRFVEIDRGSDLWVFCMGKTVWNDDFTQIIDQTNAQVVVYDAAGAEVARHALDVQGGGGAVGQDVFYAAATQEAFLLAGLTLYVFDTSNNTMGDPITIPGEHMAGGIAYNATLQQFYVTRIPSFTEAGYVSILDRSGTEVGRFDAGVVPAAIALFNTGTTLSVDGQDALPSLFRLEQNYPNPFNPSTTIPFTLVRPAHVTLTVYNALGQAVATPVDALLPAGEHAFPWQAGALPGGTYLYQLRADGQQQARLLTLLK